MEVLSVIVPIQNDERRIRSACLEIAHAARPLVWDGSIADYEIVLVDDGSTDGTAASADVFAKRDRNVVVVHHDEPRGFEASIQTGIGAARGSLIAHGRARVPLACGALRPALEKLRAEKLHAVAVHPDPKLIAGFVPGRSRAALKLVHSDPAGRGEERLPRRATRLRLEPGVPLLPKRARIGLASFAALSLAVLLVGVMVLSGNKPTPDAANGSFVGRHGHLALSVPQEGHRVARSTSAAASTSPTMSSQAVTPATPKPPSTTAKAVIPAARIDASCASDVSRPLQQLIDNAPKGTTIALADNGCYLVGSGLTIAGRDQITLDGHNATLRTGTLTCSASSEVALSNIQIVGPDGAPAIVVDDCSSVALSNVSLTSHDVGLRITGASTDVGVNTLKAATSRAAVEIASGERIALAGLSANATNAPAVQLDPPTRSDVKDVEIRDSTLTSSVADVASLGDGSVRDVWIHDNALDGGRTKVYVRSGSETPSSRWRIYRNTGDVVQSLGSYVSFTDANDILVAYNALHANVVPLRSAVHFSSAQGSLSVVNNDFTGACHAYSTDARSSHVKSEGNTTSNC